MSATGFTLTAEQRAQIDAVRSDDARVMLLQQFHQAHAFAHRDRSVFGMVADPAVFSRVWLANEAEHMAVAFAVYADEAEALAAESTIVWGMVA